MATSDEKREYHRRWREKNREKEVRRKRRYGLSPAEYQALLDSQGGLCAICKERPPVDVDHCHHTGIVRGLLCRPCNLGLGMFGETIGGLMRAVEYLKSKV